MKVSLNKQIARLKTYRYSLTYTLLKHYILAGFVLFLSVAAVYTYSSTSSFARIASDEASKELAFHISHALTIDLEGKIIVNLGEVSQWSYDALYSNIGFRVVSQKPLKALIKSAPLAEEYKTLLHYVPLSVAEGGFSFPSDLGEIIGFRYADNIDGQAIYIDVVRSDRLGKFAEQAVLPAIINSMYLAAGTSLALFLVVCLFSINSVTKKIRNISDQANQIEPEQLEKRLQVDNVPNEIQPLTEAMNRALDRVELGFNQQKRFVG